MLTLKAHTGSPSGGSSQAATLQQRDTARPPWPLRSREHLFCSTRVREVPGLPCGWSRCLSCLRASAQPFSQPLYRPQQHCQRLPPWLLT